MESSMINRALKLHLSIMYIGTLECNIINIQALNFAFYLETVIVYIQVFIDLEVFLKYKSTEREISIIKL